MPVVFTGGGLKELAASPGAEEEQAHIWKKLGPGWKGLGVVETGGHWYLLCSVQSCQGSTCLGSDHRGWLLPGPAASAEELCPEWPRLQDKSGMWACNTKICQLGID